jgi:hypothetical protein
MRQLPTVMDRGAARRMQPASAASLLGETWLDSTAR